MAKRFTDTTIWNEDWFLNLPSGYPLFWFFIKDECDHAGIWRPNTTRFNKLFSCNVSLDKALELFNHAKVRVTVLPNGRWFLNDFVKFQYGDISKNTSNLHTSVYKLLKENNADLLAIDGYVKGAPRVRQGYTKGTSRVRQGYTKGTPTPKDKDKDKDISLSLSSPSIVLNSVCNGDGNGLNINSNIVSVDNSLNAMSNQEDGNESKDDNPIPYAEIIKDLNDVLGSSYKVGAKKTKEYISARWNDGFKVEDFKVVHRKKHEEWGNDPKMSKYLRPSTLYGTKFEEYLNQKNSDGITSDISRGRLVGDNDDVEACNERQAYVD